MTDIKNAVITGYSLTTETYGCLQLWVWLDHEDGSQGFGGYALAVGRDNKHFSKKSIAGYYIMRVLEVCGVDNLTKITGMTVRVKGTDSKLTAMGHIIKDDWFTPADDLRDDEDN